MHAFRSSALSAIAAFLIITGCSKEPSVIENAQGSEGGNTEIKAISVRAGKVLASEARPRLLSGSFIISPAQSGPSPIQSMGTAGACLIADLNSINLPNTGPSCSKDTDCQGGLTGGWYGYCVASRCWVRPGTQKSHCSISAIDNGGQPWGHGTHKVPKSAPAIDVSSVYGLPGAAGKSFQWRMRACLNGLNAAGTGDNGACGGNPGPKIVDDGDTRTVN